MSVYSAPDIDPIVARNDWLLNQVAVIRNPAFTPGLFKATLGISQQYIRQHKPHNQLIKLWYPQVGQDCGLAERTIKECVKKLATAGALTHEIRPERSKRDGLTHSRSYVAFTKPFLIYPAAIFPMITEEEEKAGTKKGGKKYSIRCPHCGQYHNLTIRHTSTMYCGGCGTEIAAMRQVYDEQVENGPEQREQYTVEQMAELARLDARSMELDEAEKYADIENVPDHIVAFMGGIEAVMAADPLEIARIANMPREFCEGLEPGELDLYLQQFGRHHNDKAYGN